MILQNSAHFANTFMEGNDTLNDNVVQIDEVIATLFFLLGFIANCESQTIKNMRSVSFT